MKNRIYEPEVAMKIVPVIEQMFDGKLLYKRVPPKYAEFFLVIDESFGLSEGRIAGTVTSRSYAEKLNRENQHHHSETAYKRGNGSKVPWIESIR